MSALAIPEHLRAQLYAHALAAFPDEACGYLTGPPNTDHVDAIVRCRNAQADGEHPVAPERGADTGFVITGAELLAFARSFDSPNPARVVYHSHTNGLAYLSIVDRQMAIGSGYPVQHLVVGVADGSVREVAQFDRDLTEVARWTAMGTLST